ncbi:polysaccharide biosynthesis/export family protein [Pontibacter sp. SGAir0037]|uniref:polysaccharide biosynthesis/export family protein n=1 Tax=Pontibacter sp. SGAir0037 TaxID=2571030 RepID=UPI00352BB327
MQEQAEYKEAINNRSESKIQPDDLLSITVTSLNAESNALFNRGVLLPTGAAATNLNLNQNNMQNQEGYLVDREGNISFPVLGSIKLGGLTKEQARAKLVAEISKHVKDPIINIRHMNFRVTVVGEVLRPSTFTIPTEKINILEALGMAGDMTPFGKRENVLIIREEEGARTMARLNLNNKEVLNSPYFYLQQNDVIYVEPDKKKEIQASTDTRFYAIIGSLASVLIVVATRLF